MKKIGFHWLATTSKKYINNNILTINNINIKWVIHTYLAHLDC